MQKDSPESSSPLTGIIALLLVAGAVAVQNVPLESSRPRDTGNVKDQSVGKEDVDARLWQDPFAAMTRHIKEKKTQPLSPGGSGLEGTVEVAPDGESIAGLKATLKVPKKPDISHSIDSLQLANVQTEGKLTVLAAMVFGDSYTEGEEWRRRVRYALVSGLARSKYFAEDPDHIGYIKVKKSDIRLPETDTPMPMKDKHTTTPNSEDDEKPLNIPYEWFSNNSERLLLLWLDDDAFKSEKGGSKTLEKLAGFVKLIDSKQCEKANFQINILGPAGSDNLKNMTKEMLDIWNKPDDKTNKNILKYLRKIAFYSPFATALDDNWVREKVKQQNLELKNVSDIFNKRGLKFLSTIGTDSDLTDQLVHELDLRGVNIKTACDKPDSGAAHDHIAVVSEMDTDYARMLREAMRNSLAEESAKASGKGKVPDDGPSKSMVEDEESAKASGKGKVPSPKECLQDYSYLRGLDGQFPGVSSAPVAEKPAKDDKDKSTDAERMERAEGDDQLDYLRRLATSMREQDRKQRRANGGEIKAIGILGSDVYDKLLVLRALRGEFPNAIFFTTDLDARLLHPRETKWARNLVVASHFGFALHEDLQEDVPPFRYSYQTAMFLATRMVLDDKIIIPGAQKWLSERIQPHVFEIGRTAAVELSPDLEKKTDSSSACVRPFCDLYPEKPDPFWPNSHEVFLGLVALGLAFILACLVIPAFRRTVKSDAMYINSTFRGLLVVTLIGVLIALYLYVELLILKEKSGEPFAWFEGVSLWPTQLIRLMAIILSCYFLFRATVKLREVDSELAHEFFYGKNDKPTWNSFFKDCVGRHGIRPWIAIERVYEYDTAPTAVKLEAFWKRYLKYDSLCARVVRVALASVIFCLFCWLLLKIFGYPYVPFRGDVSKDVNSVTQIVAVGFLIVLIFYVTDVIMSSRSLIKKLCDTPPCWSAATRDRFGQKLLRKAPVSITPGNGIDECFDRWISIRLIARRTRLVGQFVYYPMIIFGLLLLARARLFDNWNVINGLTPIFAACFVIIIACVVVLRRAAEKARQKALDYLTIKLILVKGQGSEMSPLVEQLELIAHKIETIRDGAFASFFQQPLFKALAALSSTYGGFVLLEYLALANI